MSQSEVFRPSNGELIARPGPVDEGYQIGADAFRKSRPSTQSGYRFGQMSHNSFFTRHNPHPSRVRHLKGLLDVPICSVNDDGYFANPRYSLQFPPNAFNNKKLGNNRIPVNAINVNSQMHPINTVTGLQYFTGLNSYPWREKAVPKVGLVPVTEAWRDELRTLTQNLGLSLPEEKKEIRQPERPKTMYSEETGRLIPPPSRAMSRGQSRTGSRQNNRAFQHIAPEPDLENIIMTMLCQILQTEDINAVQAWLCSAGEREKTMVMDMIKAAMANKDDYYQRDVNQEFIPQSENRTVLPPINGVTQSSNSLEKTVDRLVIDEPGVPGEPSADPWKQSVPLQPPRSPVKQPIMDTDDNLANYKPPVSDAFKRPSIRPGTQGSKQDPLKVPLEPATLRYTMSAQGSRQQQPEICDQTLTRPTIDIPQVVSPNTF